MINILFADDNTRIMDEMIQFKVATPNQNGEAVWKVTLTGGGFNKPKSIAMLKVDINQIYPNNKSRPRPFTGKIDIDKTGADKDLPDNSKTHSEQSNNVSSSETLKAQQDQTGQSLPNSTSLPLPPGMVGGRNHSE